MSLVHWMALSLTAVAGQASAREVVWIDLAGVPALVQDAARREAQEVLARVGVGPRWREGGPQAVTGPGDLPVVLLAEDRLARPGPRVLGACLARSSGRVWIYLDNVARVVGVGHQHPLFADEAWRLGRALGRIVAHEVIHAVAPHLQHARSGIMSARLSRHDLMARRLDVDAETARGLQRPLMALLAASAVPPRP